MQTMRRNQTLIAFTFLSLCLACDEPASTVQVEDMGPNREDVATTQAGDLDAHFDDARLPEATIDANTPADLSMTDVATPDVGPMPDQSTAPATPCERTNDCPFPEVCNENQCDPSTECNVDADCEIGYLCNRSRNRCVIACRTQSNCPMDKVCIDQKCVDGVRCTSDRECSIGERCESDGTGGYCTEASIEPLGDMGIVPDGGLWTCNETLCAERQRCGPHPSASCSARDCLSAHGGACEEQCDCAEGLICKQNTETCVFCVNALRCDRPEVCITTGQCSLDLSLGDENSPELRILQALVQCQVSGNDDGCARFEWQVYTPDLANLKTLGCGDSLYAQNSSDQDAIQDLLRCGGSQSPIVLEPSYQENEGEVCVSHRNGYYLFHGCRTDLVPL
ncbi:MAG: hypothetical protein ACPGQS_11895 [Bradymonadia bacterium]